MRLATISAVVLFATTSAFGGWFETESNDTPALADPIPHNTVCDMEALIGFADLSPGPAGGGDVDWFSVVVPVGCYLTAITSPFGGPTTPPDTIMALFDSAGAFIVGNDDAGSDSPPGADFFGSAFRFVNFGGWASTTFFIGISGFPDFGFSGAHDKVGPYALTTSIFPEPATMGLLALGLGVIARRRR